MKYRAKVKQEFKRSYEYSLNPKTDSQLFRDKYKPYYSNKDDQNAVGMFRRSKANRL